MAPTANAVRDGGHRRDSSIDALNGNQRQVLSLIAEGRSNAAIADKLGLTEKAVTNHIGHIYRRLDLQPSPSDHRRVLAVVRALTAA